MAGEQYPRRFIKSADMLDSWAAIESYFDALRDRPIDTVEQLEAWLIDYSELAAAISEVGTDRHVKMTCQTDDPAREAAFLDFVENIDPKCKPRAHELDVRYAQSPVASALPAERYGVLDRSIRADVELFREENVPLETEDAKLKQRYQKVSGAQSVTFDGREQTLQQLALYAEDTDRAKRQAAWEVEAKRRLEDADRLQDIFDEMIQIRDRIARQAGCENHCTYAFKAKQRFDYTPDDCVAFHDAVARAVVPALRAIQKQRQGALGLAELRPWDMSVDVRGREPLRPFATVEELCEKVTRVFDRVDPELGTQFRDMRDRGYLDLESRKGKAPGGYQASYDESRHPFIFMNAVGVQRDVRTMVHEGGHAFHSYACRHDPLLSYRSSPIEFAEVASFGMELLAMDFLDEFYDEQEHARATRTQLEGIVAIFPWVATIDAFQHFLYRNPNHTRDQREAHWLELLDRFGGIADYSGYEDVRATLWQRQLHLFEVPFYYIEYGIAKLGALQVWRNALADRAAATGQYRSALALGGSRPLPELFEAAGARFDFSYDTLAPLIDAISERLAVLPM